MFTHSALPLPYFGKKSSAKILNKYLDIFNKFARIDGKYTDTRNLTWLLQNHNRKMSPDTIVKYIEALKNWSFEKSCGYMIKRFIVEDEFTNKSPEELKRISESLKELEEKIKNLPPRDKSKPNG